MATRGMFVLKPFGSYQYTNLKHGAFDVQTLRQFPGKRNYNSCLMTLGSRVDLNLAGLDVFTMEGRMAWVTQLRKRDESIQTFCYGRVPGTVSMAQPYFKGNGAGSDFFWGGIGLRLCLRGSLSVSADYDCLVNKYQTLNEAVSRSYSGSFREIILCRGLSLPRPIDVGRLGFFMRRPVFLCLKGRPRRIVGTLFPQEISFSKSVSKPLFLLKSVQETNRIAEQGIGVMMPLAKTYAFGNSLLSAFSLATFRY